MVRLSRVQERSEHVRVTAIRMTSNWSLKRRQPTARRPASKLDASQFSSLPSGRLSAGCALAPTLGVTKDALQRSTNKNRSMFAIKAEITDTNAQSWNFMEQKRLRGQSANAEGDTIFVFARKNKCGLGLIAQGTVTTAKATSKKQGVQRQTPRLSIGIQAATGVEYRFGRNELRALHNWNDGRPGTELNFKFYRQATNKALGVSPDAAAYLITCF